MKRLLATLAALLLASSAHAFTISSVQIQPGFFTAGVRVFCAGVLDTTQTITCQLYIRRATGDQGVFSLGTTAFRRPGFTNAFDGIFIGLTPGQDYVARVVVNATGQSEKLLEQSFTTRIKQFNVTGPLLYISKSGTDAGTCTSGSPCATLGYAQTQLDARVNHGIGGGIVMRPGVYRFTTAQTTTIPIGYNIWNAKPDSMYYLMSDGTNPDSTIIDFTEEHSQTWVDGANTTDSVWACKPVATNGVVMRADSILYLMRGWGDLYPIKTNLIELRYNLRLSGAAAGFAMGAAGWCWSPGGDSIYIKTPDGLSPGAEVFHLGSGDGIYVGAKYWYLSNFTVRGGNFGCVELGAFTAPYTAVGCVVDSLKLIGGREGLRGSGNTFTGAQFSDSNTVRNCTFLGLRGAMPYASAAFTLMHGHPVWMSFGQSNSIYNNTFIGCMTGPEAQTFASGLSVADTVAGSGLYIGSNKIYDSVLYGVEVTNAGNVPGGINAIVENNITKSRASTALDGVNSGSKLFASFAGPTWYIRNHIYGGHKVGIITTHNATPNPARTVLYHNTIASRGPAIFADLESNPMVSRNNIYVGHQEAGENTFATLDCADASVPTKFDFDYDMVDSTANGAGMFRWGSTTPASLAFVQRSGVEAHGIRGAYSSVDSTRSSAWPAAVTSGSAANVDAGVVIPGINTQLFGKPRYYGTAPDIGAYEWIAPTDSLHRPLNPNNRLWIKK